MTLNCRRTHPLPHLNAGEKHCTQACPVLPLKRTDLVNGWNATQFACDIGSTFWGHLLLDNACLRFALASDHPDLERAGLGEFTAGVTASRPGAEQIALTLDITGIDEARVASVEFLGFHSSYEESGSGQTPAWHGFTKARQPTATLGYVTEMPLRIEWDTLMLPVQKGVCVRAAVRFK